MGRISSVNISNSIVLEILWNRIISILDESAATLVRQAFSPVIREANDFAFVLTDSSGRSMGQSSISLPSFLATTPVTIRHFIDLFPADSLHQGDVLITNDPWKASGHLPDVTMAMPIYRRGRIIGYAGLCGHMADMGGRNRAADATDLFEEGLHIPPLKFMHKGKRDPTLASIIKRNVRVPDQVLGDMHSMVTAMERGAKRLLEVMDEYDLEVIDDVAEAILNISEQSIRRAIAAAPDGEYQAEATCDGFDEPVYLKAKVIIGGDQISVDYSGTSKQVRAGLNCVFNYTYAYTAFPIKCAFDPKTRSNDGSLRAIRVIAPEGCILNPHYGAPVGSRVITGHILHEVIFKALANGLPDNIIAGCGAPGWGLSLHGINDGEPYSVQFSFGGGEGASANKDGVSCTRFPSNIANTPIEIMELVAPVRFHSKELIRDSGGRGKCRGGLGQAVELEFTSSSAATLSLRGDHTIEPPSGILGGAPARRAQAFLNRKKFNVKRQNSVSRGDILRLETPGGGGFGVQKERPKSLLERDLIEGYVSHNPKE